MNAHQRTLLAATVAASAVCSGGCSRLIQMSVCNHCPFAITIHESVEWQYGSRMHDSGTIVPQGVFPALSMSRGESAHLQMTDSTGKFLSRVTVNAATVNGAYWDHDEIFVEVKPGQSSVVLGKSELANHPGSWRTFGIVMAVLVTLLIAFRFWQKWM